MLVTTEGKALPLRSAYLTAEASTGLARVRLRQTFLHSGPHPVHATYQLPLPDDGAVVGFAFTLQGRRYTGRVEPKERARQELERARAEGRTAALLEEERSSVFTQELGNLPPGEPVEVELELEQPLRWREGSWEWRWPTVMPPRYGSEPVGPVVLGELPVRASASLRILDVLTGQASSPSHELAREGERLSLSGPLDRDLVVRWPVSTPEPGLVLEQARPLDDPYAYGLLTVVPPTEALAPISRDLCLLLDTSGSMEPWMEQMVALCRALVCALEPTDRLEMIEFSTQPSRWRPEPVFMDEQARAEALGWLQQLEAGGGTEMTEGVREALGPLRPEAQRQVVLMSDGYIGFEPEVIGLVHQALPPGSRLHTVGLGEAPHRTLLRGAARAGGGRELLVEPGDAHALRALLAITSAPLWTQLSVEGTAVEQLAPRVPPDLMAGCPARLSLRLKPEGGSLLLRARGQAGPVQHGLWVEPTAPETGRKVIVTRFAREWVDDLELERSTASEPEPIDAQIEEVGLRYQISTRRTSWLAESDQPTVEVPAEQTVAIPHQLPRHLPPRALGLCGSVSSLLLLDVCPLSIGVEVQGGAFVPIIPRNTTIPTRKQATFSGQGPAQLRLWRGERAMARDNELIGTLVLEALPAEVELDLDANQALHVRVQGELHTFGPFSTGIHEDQQALDAPIYWLRAWLRALEAHSADPLVQQALQLDQHDRAAVQAMVDALAGCWPELAPSAPELYQWPGARLLPQ